MCQRPALEVYQAGSITNLPLTVTVQVPTTTGVSIVSNSFNVAPTQTTTGATSETLTWNFSSLAAIPSGGITWQTSVSGLQAGEALPLTLGTTVQYAALGATGSETLPPLVVAGVPATQTLVIPVQIAAPGVPALANAAAAASQIGNTNLANQFNNLATALTNLVQSPSSTVYVSQAQAAITSIVSQVSNDPFLAGYAPALTSGNAALGSATTPSAVDTAVTNLGNALDPLAQAISDEAAHGFTLGLSNTFGIVEPGSATVFDIAMENTGSATTTYDFSVSGLPAGVTATFSQPSITLAPNASIPQGNNLVTLNLSEPETDNTLFAAGFTVTATAEGAAEITLSTPGQLTLRPESLLVGAVTLSPPFTNAGGQVDVTAKILSVVNEPRQVSVAYTVTSSNGTVLASATPVMETLGHHFQPDHRGPGHLRHDHFRLGNRYRHGDRDGPVEPTPAAGRRRGHGAHRRAGDRQHQHHADRRADRHRDRHHHAASQHARPATPRR